MKNEEETLMLFFLMSPTFGNVGAVDTVPNVGDIKKKIISYLETHLLEICARRATRRLRVQLSPSIPSGALSRIGTYAELETLLLADVKSQLSMVSQKFDEENAKTVLNEEHSALQAIVETNDADAALRVVPGKELLGSFVKIVGVQDSNNIARAARRHLQPADFTQLEALQTRLKSTLSRPRAQ